MWAAGAAEVAAELRELAERVPGDSLPALQARQQAVRAAEIAATALSGDPTLAERQQRWLDVLSEVLRRLASLARQASAAIESERLSAVGASTAHLGRVNPLAAEELAAVSARCPELAGKVAAEAWPDWSSPARVRELSASRLPSADALAEIAGLLRRAVAPALALAHPDPEAVRLAALAGLIAPRTAEGRRCAAPGCGGELEAAPTGRRRVYCNPACRQRARRARLELAGAVAI